MAQAEYDEDAELFKLQMLSEYKTGSHFTFIAGYIGAIVAYGIFLMQLYRDVVTSWTALTLGGGIVVFTILFQETLPYRRHVKRLSELIAKVQKEEPLKSLEDLWKEDKFTWKWWKPRGATETKDTRSLVFFSTLAVTLWLIGFFAWSQTVVWQGAYSAVRSTSTLAGEIWYGVVAIGETLIVSLLFAFTFGSHTIMFRPIERSLTGCSDLGKE